MAVRREARSAPYSALQRRLPGKASKPSPGLGGLQSAQAQVPEGDLHKEDRGEAGAFARKEDKSHVVSCREGDAKCCRDKQCKLACTQQFTSCSLQGTKTHASANMIGGKDSNGLQGVAAKLPECDRLGGS